MSKTIRFAVYGCGMIANIHADAIRHINNAVLIGAADKCREAAVKFSEKYGIKLFDNFDDILASEEIDAVCICTPNATHAEYAIKALNKDKSVILEKPMAVSMAECDKIIEACRKSKGKLTVISQLRYSSDILKAKETVESGALGKLVLCDLYMKYYRNDEYFRGTWKGTKSMDGGGALMNQGIHGVDLLQYIAGPVKNIKSTVKTLVHDIEVEDTAVALLEFENGALGVIEASTAAYPGFDRKIEINGSKGSLVIKENNIESLIIDGKELVITDVSDSGTSSDPSMVGIEGHKNQLENFIKFLNDEEAYTIDEFEGRKAVEIIERIYNC